MDLVEKGLMESTDIGLRERLVSLRFRRDELAAEISSLSQRLSATEPVITPSKVERLAVLLRDRLQDGSPDLRQSYARLVLKEVVVKEDEIRISGSKAIPGLECRR